MKIERYIPLFNESSLISIKNKDEEVNALFDKYKNEKEQFLKKHNLRDEGIININLEEFKFLSEKGLTFCIITDKMDLFNFYQIEDDKIVHKYELNQIFSMVLGRKIFKIKNIQEMEKWLSKNAIRDEKWILKRNKNLKDFCKEYGKECYRKFIFNNNVVNIIKKYFKRIYIDFIKVRQSWDDFVKGSKELKILKRSGKIVQYVIYQSWETGIEFFILKSKVDTNTFKELTKNAGLFYHTPDEEMEERFKGWATTNIEKAKEILEKNDYFLE